MPGGSQGMILLATSAGSEISVVLAFQNCLAQSVSHGVLRSCFVAGPSCLVCMQRQCAAQKSRRRHDAIMIWSRSRYVSTTWIQSRSGPGVSTEIQIIFEKCRTPSEDTYGAGNELYAGHSITESSWRRAGDCRTDYGVDFA